MGEDLPRADSRVLVDGGRIRLDPANGSYSPQVYDERQVQVQGKLAGLLRRYH